MRLRVRGRSRWTSIWVTTRRFPPLRRRHRLQRGDRTKADLGPPSRTGRWCLPSPSRARRSLPIIDPSPTSRLPAAPGMQPRSRQDTAPRGYTAGGRKRGDLPQQPQTGRWTTQEDRVIVRRVPSPRPRPWTLPDARHRDRVPHSWRRIATPPRLAGNPQRRRSAGPRTSTTDGRALSAPRQRTNEGDDREAGLKRKQEERHARDHRDDLGPLSGEQAGAGHER